MKSDYVKGRRVSRPFLLSRSKGRKPTGPDTIRTYAYKIDYVNYHTTFYVEKLILACPLSPKGLLRRGLRNRGKKRL